MLYLLDKHKNKRQNSFKFKEESRILIKKILNHHKKFLSHSGFNFNPNEKIYSYNTANRSKYLNLMLSEKFKYKSYPKKSYKQDSIQVF